MPSPQIKKTQLKTLNFYEALKCIAQGQKVTKLEWKNKEIYGCMKDEKLVINYTDGLHPWIISTGDLAGNDYLVL